MEKSIKKNINNPFEVLKHTNFRFYWFGLIISVIGTWMHYVAQPWLAYSLTDSPFLLGLVGTTQTIPIFVFSLFTGVIIDRYPKKKILLITQASACAVTLTLALLTWTGWIQYWHILICAFLMGTINSFDMPTRQSYYIELVGKEDLMNAVALCSSAFNIARIIGPLISGIVMIYIGPALCFLVNSLSFVVMFICVSFIKHSSEHKKAEVKPGKNMFHEVAAGLNYIKKNQVLLNTLLGISIIGIFAYNYPVLVPVLAKTVLKAKATGFSILMSFMGAGSFMGAMILASTSKKGPKKIILNYVPFIIGTLLFTIGLSSIFLVIGCIIMVCGTFSVMFTSSSNTTMQLNTDQDFRGRVMAVYILVFNGSASIGNFLTGLIIDKSNVRVAYMICGTMVILLTAVLLFYKMKIMKKIEIGSENA